MLTTKPLKQRKDKPAEAIAAYCQHCKASIEHKAGYYVNRPAPSRWMGTLSGELGFRGSVDARQLVNALEGRINGEDLSRNHDKRRYGHDLTFSAPKSVSLVALVAGDERLVEAHHEAMQEAIDFIEAEVAGARRGKQGQEGRDKSGIAAAVFDHEDSRTVNGKADPQLHSHAIVLNVSKNVDGKLQALDLDWGEEAVRMHIADAIYKNQLARLAQEAGYKIERTADGFELSGISCEEIEEFSKRKEQIDEALEASGLTREGSTSEQRDAANQRTRQSKSQLSQADQRWEWRQRAHEAGLDLDFMRRVAAERETGQAEDRTAEAVKAGARDIAERETVFRRDKARLGAMQAGIGHTDLAQVDKAVDDGEAGLIDCSPPHEGVGPAPARVYTTMHAVRREQHILRVAREGRGKEPALFAEAEVEAFIVEREAKQGFQYSQGQRAAVRMGLTSEDRYLNIVGAAGAGKTTAMEGVVQGARAQGYEILGIAPSTSAARELRSAGADDTRTIASFLMSKSPEGRNDKRIMIMDESGMVSAKDMQAVMDKVEKGGGRLLLVGDPRQLSPVEAGTPYKQLIDTQTVETAEIKEIKRQKNPRLLEMTTAFSEGRAEDAIGIATQEFTECVDPPAAKHDENGKPMPSTNERREAISRATVDAYLRRTAEERSKTLLLAATNDVRRRINSKVRERLVEAGDIHGPAIGIRAFDKVDMSSERAARAESYKPGHVIKLNEKRSKRWQDVEYRVVGTQDRKVILEDRQGKRRTWPPSKEGRTFAERQMQLAAGDQVVWREPQGKGKDRIVNGTVGTVESIDTERKKAKIRIHVDDRVVEIGADDGVALDAGWAMTVHLSQGKTVDRVIVSGEANRQSTAEAAYVAGSRERYGLQIVTEDPARLGKTWSKWAEHQSAITAARREQEQHVRDQLDALRQEAARQLGIEGDLDRQTEAELDTEPEQAAEADQTPAPSPGAREAQKPALRRRPRL